jgi:dolichyl-phosphate-mannose-protein mannosyltransferase
VIVVDSQAFRLEIHRDHEARAPWLPPQPQPGRLWARKSGGALPHRGTPAAARTVRLPPMTDTEVEPATGTPEGASVRGRLIPAMPAGRVSGWAGPLLVTAFAAYLRFDRLSAPRSLVFDETYYVKDAFGILRYGVEHNVIGGNTDAMVAHGQTSIFAPGGSFIVHPPFGKLLIAAGEGLFGLTPFGWRFAVALAGTLSVLLLARITRRMTRSTLLGCVAGLLLSLDGLEFVMSRTALLDIFVMFWALAAFGCLVIDRDQARLRLAAAVTAPSAGRGPGLGVRWWRVLAGVCLGLACASKWDGIWYLAAFAAMCVTWDIGARRAAGFQRSGFGALADAAWLPVSLVVIPAAVYLATWSGWFASSIGWDRTYAAQHGVGNPVLSALYSLVEYHKQMLTFHVSLHARHPYQSQPWTWLVMSRPVAFFYASPAAGHNGCQVAHCSQEVLAIGTPMIWWASIAALTVMIIWWLTQRDWRAGAVLVGVAAGWLPWFAFASRTKFFFYTVSFEPYLIIAITLCLGLIIGAARASPLRRGLGAAIAGSYLMVVVLNFFYLYPILAAKVIPYDAWHARMWFSGWI